MSEKIIELQSNICAKHMPHFKLKFKDVTTIKGNSRYVLYGLIFIVIILFLGTGNKSLEFKLSNLFESVAIFIFIFIIATLVDRFKKKKK